MEEHPGRKSGEKSQTEVQHHLQVSVAWFLGKKVSKQRRLFFSNKLRGRFPWIPLEDTVSFTNTTLKSALFERFLGISGFYRL